MKTINTPLLDAAIQTHPKYAPRFDRFVNAKADLIEGVEKKHIWNVDFVDAKDRLSRAIDAACDMAFEASLPEFWRVRDLSSASPKEWDLKERTLEAHEEFHSTCQMNQAAGRIKRLSKFMDLPNVAEYVALLKEVVLLHELVQAAKPFIEKGRKPSENPVEADITNTGHCAICGNRQKMTANQKMVHHGFQISGGTGHYFGYRLGSCFGVGYAPVELSCEANVAYIPALQNFLEQTIATIDSLEKKTAPSHSETRQKREGYRYVSFTVEHLKGTPEYASINRSKILQQQSLVRQIEGDIERQRHNVKVWKPRKFDW
jgi:hypothetical protein